MYKIYKYQNKMRWSICLCILLDLNKTTYHHMQIIIAIYFTV